LPQIIFTVTNDLTYDQRMHRIAGTLSRNGFDVLLVGRKMKTSFPLQPKPFEQKRLHCFFEKGFPFYAEYNFRLFFFLLFTRADIVCAIDLDTILPVYFVSAIKRQKRVYDAHELFTEQQEIISRPGIYRFWLMIERFAVPKFRKGYTVNDMLVKEFSKRYQVQYGLIRNLPFYRASADEPTMPEKIIIYQGAVNEGRCFETLIPAMEQVQARLVVCGTGNFIEQAKQLTQQYCLEDKILFYGSLLPEILAEHTQQAYIGVTLFEAGGMNQYHSLANRFFDYIMAGKPQVCVNYPAYASINSEYEVAYLVDDTQPGTIAAALNRLLTDNVLYNRLQTNCRQAKEVLNWTHEQDHLIRFYRDV
jgi:glycosyltransferase involved in cell wall biosynthesis